MAGSDADGNPLRFEIVRLEASTLGAVQLTNPTTGAFIYTPPTGYVGNDVFFYRVLDGAQVSSVAKATISVTGGPRITKVAAQGVGALRRQLIVVGESFDPDASVLVNRQRLAARNDRVTPNTRLVAFLEPGVIQPDAQGMVKVQVRNPDGSLSAEFPFKLPRR